MLDEKMSAFKTPDERKQNSRGLSEDIKSDGKSEVKSDGKSQSNSQSSDNENL